MREIKFRAWDRTSDIMRTDISSIDYDGSGKVAQINVVTGVDILFPDKEAILMQYTGLKDKNGVEIYEGDIVRDLSQRIYLADTRKKLSRLGAVQYGVYYAPADDPYCSAMVEGLHIEGGTLSPNLRDYSIEEIEVIGNIYENPELLKDSTND